MSLIGNFLWFIFGGVLLWLAWLIAGLLCMITIIGIPIGLQCFKFAALMLAPFGRDIDYGQAGTVSFLANILWILFLGWELAVTAVVIGLVYCLTIIGIPFGLQAFKFARLALMPFGARIVRALLRTKGHGFDCGILEIEPTLGDRTDPLLCKL